MQDQAGKIDDPCYCNENSNDPCIFLYENDQSQSIKPSEHAKEPTSCNNLEQTAPLLLYMVEQNNKGHQINYNAQTLPCKRPSDFTFSFSSAEIMGGINEKQTACLAQRKLWRN